MRVRLEKDGDVFRLEGTDTPKDGSGYISSLQEMLPGWVRDRVTRQESRDQMEDALVAAAADWTRPNVPADLLVEQVSATIPDPHEHQPPSWQYRMLAARYVDCRLAKIAPPSSDEYQAEFGQVSEDGRFRLFLLPSRVAVEDARTCVWSSIVTPAHPLLSMAPAVFDPAWREHRLFIDFATSIIDPLHPTLTHYEIDFDN